MNQRQYVLLDRDGTINIDKHYLSDPGQLELIDGAAAAIRRLNQADIGVLIITNQSGIGRGYFTYEQLNCVHDKLKILLAEQGAKIDGIYICPHDPQTPCQCRKPLSGLVTEALKTHDFKPDQSIMIGDKEADIGLGRALKALTILVRTGEGRATEQKGSQADYVTQDLAEAISLIFAKQLVRSGR